LSTACWLASALTCVAALAWFCSDLICLPRALICWRSVVEAAVRFLMAVVCVCLTNALA
jgi:hypothetical protein